MQQDFQSDWSELIVKPLGIKELPKEIQLPEIQEWARQSGGAVWEFNKAPATVMLSTITGFGKTISFMSMTNSRNYGKIITSFLSDFMLKKPALPLQTSAAANAGPALVGTWQKKSSLHETDGTSGYHKLQYTFKSDGTYEFYSKTYASADTSIYLVRESGAWQARGNTLVIDPSKSNIEAWSKKNGTDKYGDHMNARPRALERTAYQFAKNYFSGIDEWQLVLTNEKPTQRDGPFTANSAFPMSWLYGPINSSRPLIDLPN